MHPDNRGLLVATLVLVAAVATAAIVFATPTHALPVGTAVTSGSGSMAPTFQGGELLVYAETGDYQEGDVVVYDPETVDANPEWFAHRVNATHNGGRYTTKGDALEETDVAYHGEYATDETIAGEVVFVLRT